MAELREWGVELAPMGRAELATEVTITKEMTSEADDIWLTLRGDFEAGGRPVLAFRLVMADVGR